MKIMKIMWWYYHFNMIMIWTYCVIIDNYIYKYIHIDVMRCWVCSPTSQPPYHRFHHGFHGWYEKYERGKGFLDIDVKQGCSFTSMNKPQLLGFWSLTFSNELFSCTGGGWANVSPEFMKLWDLASRALKQIHTNHSRHWGEVGVVGVDEYWWVRCAVQHQQDLWLNGYHSISGSYREKIPRGRVYRRKTRLGCLGPWMNSFSIWRRDKATERPGHWREVVVLQQPVSNVQERFFLPCSVLRETFCVIQPHKMGSTCCDY